jgi:hypothetical protein
MALGSTQPLREMSTRNLCGGKGRPARGADNLTAVCEQIFEKIWGLRRLAILWASMACYRDSFTFTFYNLIVSFTLRLFTIIKIHVVSQKLKGISWFII